MPTLLRSKWQSFYEWSGIGFSLLALTCMTLWIVTLTCRPINDRLNWLEVYISIRNDCLAIHTEDIDDMQSWDKYAPRPTDSNRPAVRRFNIPGFHFLWHRYPFGGTDWALEISFLYLSLVAGLAGTFCLCRYQRSCRRLKSSTLAALESRL